MTAAAVEPVTLRWEVPPGCPSVGEVAARIEVYRAGSSARSGVDTQGVITASAQGYALALTITTPDGATALALQDRQCEALVDAAALVIALHLDVTRVPSRRPTPAAGPHRRALTGSLRVFAGAAAGLGPAIAPVAGAGLGLARGRLRGDVGFTEGLWRTLPSERDPSVGVAVRGGAVDLRACYAPQLGRWQALLCGDVEVGAAIARGVGVVNAWTRRAPWVSAGLGAGIVAWIAPNIGLTLEGRGHAALTRPQFALDGLGVIYRALPAGARVLVGLEVRFAVLRRRALTTGARTGD